MIMSYIFAGLIVMKNGRDKMRKNNSAQQDTFFISFPLFSERLFITDFNCI